MLNDQLNESTVSDVWSIVCSYYQYNVQIKYKGPIYLKNLLTSENDNSYNKYEKN